MERTSLWDWFRPLRRVSRIIVYLYAVLTVGVPSILARVQYLKAAAEPLADSARFVGTVVVFSAVFVAFIALAALMIYFVRENGRWAPNKAASVETEAPTNGAEPASVLLTQTREYYETKIRDLEKKLEGFHVISRDLIQMKSPGRVEQLERQNADLKKQISDAALAREETSRELEPWQTMVAAKDARIAELEKTTGPLEDKVHTQRKHLERCDAEIKEHTETIKRLQDQLLWEQGQTNAARSESTRRFEANRYGRSMSAMKSLSEAQFVDMKGRIEEIAPDLGSMQQAMARTWSELIEPISVLGPEFELAQLLGFVATEVQRTENAFSLFWEKLQDTNDDPRPSLLAAYLGYREWRGWLIRFAAFRKVYLVKLSGTPGLVAAEMRFFERFSEKLAVSSLAEVREEVFRYAKSHANQPSMQPPPSMLLDGNSGAPPSPSAES